MNILDRPVYGTGAGCAAGVDTSEAAAEHVRPWLAPMRRKVLGQFVRLGDHGGTSHEVSAQLQMENTSVQPRVCELSLFGLIRDSGQRRPNRSGCKARVYVITDHGRQAYGR